MNTSFNERNGVSLLRSVILGLYIGFIIGPGSFDSKASAFLQLRASRSAQELFSAILDIRMKPLPT